MLACDNNTFRCTSPAGGQMLTFMHACGGGPSL
jgi:hypothetical protein